MTPQSTTHSFSPNFDAPELTVGAVLTTVRRGKRTLMIAVLLGASLGTGLAFLRARTWTSGFTFVPLQSNPSVGGIASLAGQFGLNIGSLGGSSRPPEFFVAAVQTRDVLLPVIRDSIVLNRRRVAVLDFLEVEGDVPEVRLERGLKQVRNEVLTVGVADRQSSIVRVSVRTESAEASHAIASLLLDALNTFNVQSRRGQASTERRFARERLDSATAALSVAEDRLTLFVDRNRDLTASAALGLQRDRLQREVTVQQQLVGALTQQYEEARLREYRDTPEVSVVERPYRPPLPNSRMAAVTLAVGALAGLIVGVLVVLRRDDRTEGRAQDGPTPAAAAGRASTDGR